MRALSDAMYGTAAPHARRRDLLGMGGDEGVRTSLGQLCRSLGGRREPRLERHAPRLRELPEQRLRKALGAGIGDGVLVEVDDERVAGEDCRERVGRVGDRLRQPGLRQLNGELLEVRLPRRQKPERDGMYGSRTRPRERLRSGAHDDGACLAVVAPDLDGAEEDLDRGAVLRHRHAEDRIADPEAGMAGSDVLRVALRGRALRRAGANVEEELVVRHDAQLGSGEGPTERPSFLQAEVDLAAIRRSKPVLRVQREALLALALLAVEPQLRKPDDLDTADRLLARRA